MTKLTLTLITAAGLALVGTTTLACASTSRNESTGEYLDNSIITAKVKSSILNEPTLKSFEITVKTYKDVVQLSGFVDSAASVRLAGEVAAGVKGVSKVANDLLVK
jgi:osmotically-inducible protein OsmY